MVRQIITPSRRSLLTGAAWSVPAVVIAATSPAYADSDEDGTEAAPAATALTIDESTTATFTTQDTQTDFTAAIPISNPTDRATTGLQLQVTVPSAYYTLGAPLGMTITSPDRTWVATPILSTTPVRYVLTPSTQLAARTSTTIDVHVRLSTAPSTLAPLTLELVATNVSTATRTLQPTRG